MNRELAEKLLLLVNTPDLYKALQEYILWRQDLARADVTSAQDMRALGMIQGRLQELQYLRSVREAVLAHSREPQS